MSETVTGGEAVARVLEALGVTTVFGVISIHNVPILDAIHRRGSIRFVPARSESGATNMADGFARVRDALGVVITSTGPGAGNGCGAMTEALSAGSPVLHLTGQIDSPDLDRGKAMNHETADQLSMLRAVSKAAFRVRHVQEIERIVAQAATIALTDPRGPVSVELPIDLQKAQVATSPRRMPRAAEPAFDAEGVKDLARALAGSRRPLLWVGGGARRAGAEIAALLGRGVRAVSSVHGRGTIADDDEGSLGALANSAATEAFYPSCDLMIVVGSKLRGNETRSHGIALPRPLAVVDVDLAAWNRNYATDLFVHGDAKAVIGALLQQLPADWRAEPGFNVDFARMKREAVGEMRAAIGPYADMSDALRRAMPRDAVFVRDVTISANTWGNRLLPMYAPGDSVSALGGGIGQGLQQAIGAAIAADGRKTVVLCGDGGLAVNIGELMTAVQERVDLLVVVMNDGGYGVLRNITRAAYAGRTFFSDLFLPDLQDLGRLLKMRTWRVADLAGFEAVIGEAVGADGPRLLEVDMKSFGDFPVPFAGPRSG